MIGSALKDEETEEVILIDPHMRNCECMGVAWAIGGLSDVCCVFHAAVGCQSNLILNRVTKGDIPRYTTSDLSENEVVFGGEKKLARCIEKTDKIFGPKVMIVLTGCVPELIGDDIEGVISDVRSKVNAQLIPVHVAGFKGDHHSGYRKALMALIDNLMEDTGKKVLNSINLVGVINEEYRRVADVQELKRILNRVGIILNSVLMGEGTVDDVVKKAPEAELNVVLSRVDGLEAAEHMKEKFGIPYIAPLPPYGIEGTTGWLLEIAKFFNLDEKAKEVAKDEQDKVYPKMRPGFWALLTMPGQPFFIISNPVSATGITRFLAKELGLFPYAVISSGGEVAEQMINEVIADLNPPVPTTVLVDPGFYDIRNAFVNSFKFMKGLIGAESTPIYLGSSHEKLLVDQYLLSHSRRVKIPFVRVSLPIFDAPEVNDYPYMGYEGALNLARDVFTATIEMSFPLNAWSNPWVWE